MSRTIDIAKGTVVVERVGLSKLAARNDGMSCHRSGPPPDWTPTPSPERPSPAPPAPFDCYAAYASQPLQVFYDGQGADIKSLDIATGTYNFRLHVPQAKNA